MLSKGLPTAILMCKYYVFEEAQTATLMCKYYTFKWVSPPSAMYKSRKASNQLL